MPSDHKDILIVGAGPAGLSTALHLSLLAPHLVEHILVLEKESHPRPKPCAGALVVDAEVLLEHLGLDVNEVPCARAESAHFHFEGRGMDLRLRKRPALRIIRREEFDLWLVQKARERGIEIREQVRVISVHPAAEGVTVETSASIFHARVVVGADGSNGIVRGCILPDSPRHTARVLEVHVSPVVESPHQTSGAYFDFFCVPAGIAGYTWDFPTQSGGQPMRCWGIFDNNLLADGQRPPLRSLLASEMERCGYHLAEGDLKGFPIRWFNPFGRFAVPGVLLAGDAAGTDALFGEGISMALGYGRLAARSILSAFEREDFSFRDYPRHLLCSSLGQVISLRTLITYILYSFQWRWFQRFFWQGLSPLVRLAGGLLVINWAKRMK